MNDLCIFFGRERSGVGANAITVPLLCHVQDMLCDYCSARASEGGYLVHEQAVESRENRLEGVVDRNKEVNHPSWWTDVALALKSVRFDQRDQHCRVKCRLGVFKTLGHFAHNTDDCFERLISRLLGVVGNFIMGLLNIILPCCNDVCIISMIGALKN